MQPRSIKLIGWGLWTVVLMLYLFILGDVYLNQNQFLYLRQPVSLSETLRLAQKFHLLLWPESNPNYKGLIDSNVMEKATRGTIICVHGNANDATARRFDIDALKPLGFNVLLYEYPGYGSRPGNPNEIAIISDLKSTILEAAKKLGEPVYLWGESLGAGVVASVAADPSLPIKGLVLVTPWDRLNSVAQFRYWYLPTAYLLHDRYNSGENLQKFHFPVAVAISDHDEIIPPRFAQNLYSLLPGPKKLWIFKNVGHADWPKEPNLAWWKEVTDFITSNSASASSR